LYIAQLVSQKKFVTSEFATLINPVLPIIIYIGSTFLEVKLNLFILVSVLLIGAVSEYSYLYYKTKRILFKLNFSLNFSEIKYLKEILFLFFSSIILSLMTLVDVYFASNLSSGDVSLLLTSSKFIAFGIGVLSSSVGIMIIPYLAEAYLISINYFIKFINKVLIYTFLTCIIILTFAYFLIPEIIPLLFKSETISSLDIDYLVSYILVGLPIIPLSLIGLILSRGMISLGISKKMIAINIIALAINIVSDYFLVKEYSVVGLILSTSVVYLWTSLSMYWAIRLKTKKIKDN